MTKQPLDLITGNYTAFFIKIILIVIMAYLIVMLINFFRDKFINNKTSLSPNFTDLLSILNALFVISGIGFIIANVMNFILSRSSVWNNLTSGIILIFIGLGFKHAIKAIQNRTNSEDTF